MGVQQGSPLIPTIFNIFINALAGSLASIPLTISEVPANLFADDIILMTRNGKGLQTMLDIFERWTRLHLMQWAPNKCVAIFDRHIAWTAVHIGEHVLSESQSTRYLGV